MQASSHLLIALLTPIMTLQYGDTFNMHTLKRHFTALVFTGFVMLSFALLPTWLSASAMPITDRHGYSDRNTPALSATHKTGMTSSMGSLTQERNSLALAGLAFLVIGTALRIRRRVSQDQPVVSDALVGQSHLPLAS